MLRILARILLAATAPWVLLAPWASAVRAQGGAGGPHGLAQLHRHRDQYQHRLRLGLLPPVPGSYRPPAASP